MSGDHRSAIVYHPELLAYDFGPQHPLRPERITVSLDLLREAGLWDPETETLSPEPATPAELELVHDPAFIRAVQDAGADPFYRRDLERFGLSAGDNPPFPDMHEAAALVTGGSVGAVRQVLSGELLHAFNPAGGLHHALRDRASGFCVYNDPAVAAAVALKEFGARVLYADFDCHHGDGVQWIFYDEPRVMTISLHETGHYLFPGTGDVAEMGTGAGVGFSVNIPMAPFTQDESWLEAVYAVLPPLVERFSPDIIITSHGADTHLWDPLTHLALSTRSFFDQARLVHELAHRHSGGRWLAVGSGGYDWQRVVPRSWAIVWAEMSGRQLPERLPEAWRERWGSKPAQQLPEAYRDAAEVRRPMPRAQSIAAVNRETVQAVLRAVGVSAAASQRAAERTSRGQTSTSA